MEEVTLSLTLRNKMILTGGEGDVGPQGDPDT